MTGVPGLPTPDSRNYKLQRASTLALLFVNALASDTAEDTPHAVLDNRLELLFALHKKTSCEAHGVDAELVARFRQCESLLFARDNVYMLEGEDDVV